MKTVYKISLPVLFALAAIGLVACVNMGASPTAESLRMHQESKNFRDTEFVNQEDVSMELQGSSLETTFKFFFSRDRRPKEVIPMVTPKNGAFPSTPHPLQAVWLGHSTTILDIDGVRILMDPVFGNASPVPFTVTRYQDSPINRDNLPRVDAVVISHDHYDHLERSTIKALASRAPLFIVPLGVGAHLQKWGCPPEKIIELDWWQSHDLLGVEIIATPTQHFSGRGLRDRNKTLWAGYAFIGPQHRAYYTGDGGYDGRFREIGKQFGPFDLTIIEAGAWNKMWPTVHMFPEESVAAHVELGGKYMLPVHWGAYDLAFHKWDEPIKLVAEAARVKGINLLTPMMGEPTIPGQTTHHAWWQAAPEASLAEAR